MKTCRNKRICHLARPWHGVWDGILSTWLKHV